MHLKDEILYKTRQATLVHLFASKRNPEIKQGQRGKRVGRDNGATAIR
jgi:hypothetical protein